MSKLGCQKLLLQKYSKYLKPFALSGTLIFISLILITTWQNFFLLSWDLLFYIGFVLPFTFHIFILILSKIFCLKVSSIKTVVVECGIQSSSASLFILLLSLGEPERDVALIIPLATALFTDKLLLFFCFIRIIRRAILALTKNKNIVIASEMTTIK
nr:unnamed protein product [Meloidogyne enterolobii]